MKNRIKTLLGFAQRSGKIISGTNTCKAKLKKIKLVIIAEDSSNDVIDYFRYKCENDNKPIYILFSKIEIGLIIGKSPRTVIGIMDNHFAKEIKDLIVNCN